MPVLRSILHGFGFTIGARAADEMLEEMAAKETTDSIPPAPSAREIDRARRERAKAAKKRDREVERELAAMKKRVARGE